MTDDPPIAANDDTLHARIAELRLEHEDMDAAIRALEHEPQPDQLRIARLKRRKLALRDQIVALENQLTPDIIA
jgi:hypothetical protein